MARRPPHLSMNSVDSSESMPPRSPFHLDLPSPRVGEQPPPLSPLDAIAMRSRMLAKKFEQPTEGGRRISRLPYNDVARELAIEPDYFRGIRNGMRSGMEDVPEETSPTNVQPRSNVVNNGYKSERPMSHYPVFGNASDRSSSRQSGMIPFYDAEEELGGKEQTQGYFDLGAPRAASPEPVDQRIMNVQAATPTNMPSLTSSVDTIQSSGQSRTLTNGSARSQRSLAPPKSPGYPKSPRSIRSIRSVPPDSDDDGPFNNGSQATSSLRKHSGSSGMSRPQSPFSPYLHHHAGSPSVSSEFSFGGTRKVSNFSRPLSTTSLRQRAESRPSLDSRSSFETRPSAELPHRHPSAASGSTIPSSGIPSRQQSEDDHIPMPGAFVPDEKEDDDARPTTSYTYSKYTLPRGAKVERNSRGTRESWIRKQFTWDDDTSHILQPQTPVQEEEPTPEPSTMQPISRIESLPERRYSLEPPPPIFGQPPRPASAADYSRRPSLEPPPSLFQPPTRPSSVAGSDRSRSSWQGRFGRTRADSSTSRSRSVEPRTMQKAAALHKSTPSVRTHGTDSTDRTIRAGPLHERASSTEMTAEEHLEIGIATHSAGELNKSTYHLRLAAKGGSPTGMLLYALACRHGWGMRPNQEEGVRWLKKAIDGAGLQVADIETTLDSATSSTTPNGVKLDPLSQAQERKKRKAQFALAIYELGISYMNGWGCAKDKPLAVQCYEVAGSWGDCDALAEAAFCYAQGMGVKKDLKRAAGLYRKAAEGGMSVAGISWIYKPKYMDEGPAKDANAGAPAPSIKEDKEKEGKTGSRARSRSIWGRSKK